MKELTEIKNFAVKEYDNFLKDYFSGVDFFPLMHKSFGKYNRDELQKKFQKITQDVQLLLDNSKEKVGYGYEIVWEQINSRSVGKNQYPKTIQFNTQTDYLKFISKENEFSILVEDSNYLLRKFPELKKWFLANPYSLIPISLKLEKVISICEYFQKNPRPNIYLRELPILGVDTKFIEDNQRILKIFLDEILSPENMNLKEPDFETRYFLKSKPNLIRFRILDPSINKLFPRNIFDITLTFDEFQDLQFEENNIFITENQINFLAFPKLESSLIVVGSGYNVVNIGKLENLKSKTFYYWGDLDSHGFDILSKFREYFPSISVKSFLMNKETYETFSHLATDLNKPIDYVPSKLYPEETFLFEYINSLEKNNRLEQERIPLFYIKEILEKMKIELSSKIQKSSVC